MCGQQEPWPLVEEGRQPSPYRPLSADLIEAAARLGYVYDDIPDPYRLPPIIDKDIARPVFDLGCLGGAHIPDPRGMHRRGGPGGGGGDDYDNGDDDQPGAGDMPPDFQITPIDHCALLCGTAQIADLFRAHGGVPGVEPNRLMAIEPPGLARRPPAVSRSGPGAPSQASGSLPPVPEDLPAGPSGEGSSLPSGDAQPLASTSRTSIVGGESLPTRGNKRRLQDPAAPQTKK